MPVGSGLGVQDTKSSRFQVTGFELKLAAGKEERRQMLAYLEPEAQKLER